MPEPDPLILTLVLDAGSQSRFDDLRTAHFPPARNHLAAHVTLFHALPGGLAAGITEHLATVSAARPCFDVEVVGLRSLDGGVAFDLASPPLTELRAGLARRWSAVLTRQDASGLRPHVTVQNKVPRATAAALLDGLRRGFRPWSATAEGLSLWWYRGGPWEHERTFHFPEAPPC